jgi:glycosyltransferase involved in cell wall biosynthesis
MRADDTMTVGTPPRVAILASFSGSGGVERMIANLANGMSARGVQVDLLLIKSRSRHLATVSGQVNILPLGSRHAYSSLVPLTRYLRQQRPVALLAAKDRAGRVAVLARWLSGVSCRLVIRIGTTVSAALAGRGRLRRALWYAGMRRFYPRADAVIAVSRGVAQDIRAVTGLGGDRLQVVPNPVIDASLFERAAEPVEHPWLLEETVPVILGIGRLTRQKDFGTLLGAFARVRKRQSCRLVILGEGRDRPRLEAQAQRLGVAADVSLPGFIANPYAYLSRARLFALSSAWEGSPNALTEALALGVPVVATDCPSGPREILDEGRVAPLVPVGDVAALAGAMERVLRQPPPAELLRRAAADYTVEHSTRRYLEVLGVETPANAGHGQ